MNRIEPAVTEPQAIRQRIRRGEITGHLSGFVRISNLNNSRLAPL
jgi:hypothetical protein